MGGLLLGTQGSSRSPKTYVIFTGHSKLATDIKYTNYLNCVDKGRKTSKEGNTESKERKTKTES